MEEDKEICGGALTSDGVDALEIDDEPSEEDEELPPEFIFTG